jgi:hypothetical protein
LNRMNQTGLLKNNKVRFMSMGGPLGNTNPVYQSYLTFAHKGILKNVDEVIEWHDFWNPDDAVCSNYLSPSSILGLMPKLSQNNFNFLLDNIAKSIPAPKQYEPYANAIPHRIEYGGRPTSPMSEHGSYFEVQACYDKLKQLLSA